MLAHPWPGNVRELKNCIEQAFVFAEHEQIDAGDLPISAAPPRAEGAPHNDPRCHDGEIERYAILETLRPFRARPCEPPASWASVSAPSSTGSRSGVSMRATAHWSRSLATRSGGSSGAVATCAPTPSVTQFQFRLDHSSAGGAVAGVVPTGRSRAGGLRLG